LLLASGADLNWIGHDNKTPLDCAVGSGRQELVVWLRGEGATFA
jgi:ankyrin repeat protein